MTAPAFSIRQRLLAATLAAFVIFLIDRAMKYLVRTGWSWGEGWLVVAQRPNSGILFGIWLGEMVILALASILCVILIGLAIRLIRQQRLQESIGMITLILGAVSNLIDRIRFGAVIDYILVLHWSAFNIADLMIFSGVVIILSRFLRPRPA